MTVRRTLASALTSGFGRHMSVRTFGTGRTALAPAVRAPSFPARAGAYVYEYSWMTSALIWPVALAHDRAAGTVQCVATNSL